MKAWPLIVFALVFTAPHSATACSCLPQPPPAEALAVSDAVFSGTVLRIDAEKEDELGGRNRVLFKVHRTWKGVAGRTVTVTTAATSAACGVGFQHGSSYLVYANGAPDLSANSCSRTRLLANAQEDLDALGPGTSTLPPWLAQLLRRIFTHLCALGFPVCDLILHL